MYSFVSEWVVRWLERQNDREDAGWIDKACRLWQWNGDKRCIDVAELYVLWRRCWLGLAYLYLWFLANVKSRSRSLYVVARPSVVCLSSVTFVRPTQAIEIFCNVSTSFGTLAIPDLSVKILRRLSQENPSVGGVKHGVAEYSDCGPIERYISETVQR